MPRVLIGEVTGGSFKGFWAEFEGKTVGEPEVRKDNHTWTLYEVPWGQKGDQVGYRVYEADEKDVLQPEYRLFPIADDSRSLDYEEEYYLAYTVAGLVSKWPIFAKYIKNDYRLRVRSIDPHQNYDRRWRD